ncbi:unnamed protein product [Peronospora destructor]|uniref:BON domain-containing protein n=1 Tax=Peronospora destructor TaxID=86335 RepID=A0AAV0UYW5_9STRA|nr:unnamed protein product [Peronospora destructor]
MEPIASGSIKVGDPTECHVAPNHMTHVLNFALNKALKTTVDQRGSLVDDRICISISRTRRVHCQGYLSVLGTPHDLAVEAELDAIDKLDGIESVEQVSSISTRIREPRQEDQKEDATTHAANGDRDATAEATNVKEADQDIVMVKFGVRYGLETRL